MKVSPHSVAAFLLLILGVSILGVAGLIGYETLLQHGDTCASGGGPASCIPAGGWASPARIIVGLVFAVPVAVLGVLTLRAAVRAGRRGLQDGAGAAPGAAR